MTVRIKRTKRTRNVADPEATAEAEVAERKRVPSIRKREMPLKALHQAALLVGEL
jgi:hypothetical protein